MGDSINDKDFGLSNHEPPPEDSDHPAVWDLIKQDIEERDVYGQNKYGTRLKPFNGRDPTVDAYQEVLDLLVYHRQMIYEFSKLKEELENEKSSSSQLRALNNSINKQVCSLQSQLFAAKKSIKAIIDSLDDDNNYIATLLNNISLDPK